MSKNVAQLSTKPWTLVSPAGITNFVGFVEAFISTFAVTSGVGSCAAVPTVKRVGNRAAIRAVRIFIVSS